MPYQPETSYFVNLDAPPPLSRHTPQERQRFDERSSVPPPGARRRRRKMQIRPVGLLLIVLLAGLGWSYTTPGGPSARMNDWIDRIRGDVANVSAGPGLDQTASYFNGLYASQGAYPDLSDTAIQSDPKAGFGVSMNFIWCNGRAVVLQNLNSGGSLSRLLLDGHDLGDVSGSQSCPQNFVNPAPWKVASG